LAWGAVGEPLSWHNLALPLPELMIHPVPSYRALEFSGLFVKSAHSISSNRRASRRRRAPRRRRRLFSLRSFAYGNPRNNSARSSVIVLMHNAPAPLPPVRESTAALTRQIPLNNANTM